MLAFVVPAWPRPQLVHARTETGVSDSLPCLFLFCFGWNGTLGARGGVEAQQIPVLVFKAGKRHKWDMFREVLSV